MESIFLELFPPRGGEHQYAAYNENHLPDNIPKDQTLFYSKQENRIQNFWRLPSNLEVLQIDVDIDAFKKANMPHNFNYFLGVPADKTLPEFICDDPLERVMMRVSKITLADSRDLDATLKEKSRLVEFTEAFDYSVAGRSSSYLSYFKSVNNIFDLEFFTNKLASSAKCIANLEKMVLSGVPFWEEGDDALFGDMDDDEESEEEKQPV